MSATKTDQGQGNKQQDAQKRQEGQDQRRQEQGSHNPGQNPNNPQQGQNDRENEQRGHNPNQQRPEHPNKS